MAEPMYLDALVPEDGQSLRDLMGTGFIEAVRAAAKAAGPTSMIPPMFSIEDTTGWSGPTL